MRTLERSGRRDLLLTLAEAELREHRSFTIGGLVRWISEPVSYMFVYFLLVVVVLHRSSSAYLLLLFCALAPWRYFTATTSAAMSVITRSRDQLQNRSFARDVLPLVILGVEGISFLVSLVIVIPLMAFYSIGPTVNLLWVPLIVAVLVVLSSGPTYFFAVFALYFPDLRGIVQNIIRAVFFISTGLVPVERIPGNRLPDLIMLNPFSGLFESFRAAVVYGRAPRPLHLLYPFAMGLVWLAIGLMVYRWRQPSFAKEV